ncbi:MAG TPA: hypothetical protein ENH62_02740 [Marinobacter sp.]|uniref:Uncharacterized protein n=1 Tax=marine sediment metagenome TaxID=412755 RepID=A0A0F9R1W7_9ZZZZ|nr:hypothetical protein [Marinobacter sp.]HEC61442.1 hypothetical protein [bacterium]
MSEDNSFEQWCIIELFGHQVIAGMVTQQAVGSAALIRVDVPETEDHPAFTRFYGLGAIYSITPVSEEVAKVAVKEFRPKPVNVYMPQLVEKTHRQDEDGYAE